MKIEALILGVLISNFLAIDLSAQIGSWEPDANQRAMQALEQMTKKNSRLESYVCDSYAYVIFPTVAKGAAWVGAAYGRGVVFQQGQEVGDAKLTQVTVGWQWGGQAYTEVLFFEDETAFERFKSNEIKFAGQVSAIAFTTGASADIAYEEGVAVFTMPKGGLMYEASLGGQKFTFLPN